ncbi:hypothetical protein HRR83_003648 [Exophiala dermatitidis]|uniref:Cell wall proline rich protein n=2 Tax=Exophiala dermatitidis TaxID=5970 RepID=H6BSZ3_EXODN|nr:uncharacterized protein HMPREF1120_01635 [Exophiala dermatitidis NIH/UT8656]KAJ4519043.1 hypothetical protein HRR75_002721 [Exophiala dermatitidis]EHY53442.1 hypothetical protein HMPREF1120_01635 [Exophiala dermatitidis NIH/UT8656]KAJ4522387.1 hypothetical protein HRR74_002972 [Exophiala dermatitidis]KAJ4529712.1 hypothetical protein HRR73_000740 [Exophiala dermatitidis]KAJ4543123.1 hypothetical protein HRR77_005381 [Exophiala dermatitidis]
MTSISLPPTLPAHSPFDSLAGTPPRSPRSHAHRRRPSRDPNAAHNLPTTTLASSASEDTLRVRGVGTSNQGAAGMAVETRRRSMRAPLPDFKFNPGADLPPERDESPTHPVLQEMALNQQRAIRSARAAPLPAFTFGSQATPAQASPSPTKSSFADTTQPVRTGHRRYGSEFVGAGDDGPQIVSTSPEKPEYRLPPPANGAPRGHVHRRSQAVSISDIDTSELIKMNALAKARAGSTPTTPAESAQPFAYARPSPHMRQSMSNIVRTPPSSPRRRGSAPGFRPRVGFSDYVDVIPRPLSLISSETEGSTSTIRGGHSLSGSINSIASPTPRPIIAVSPSADMDISPERPQTADALSTQLAGVPAESMINLPKRPLSASGSPGALSTGSPPSKKKYFWFSHSNNGSPSTTPRAEVGDPLDVFTSPECTQPPTLKSVSHAPDRPKTSEEPVPASKKRKYHTWTSGIFSRKSDKRSAKPKEQGSPSPPELKRQLSDRLSDIFDADNTVVIRDPSPVSTRVRPLLPAVTPKQPEEQVTGPVLDLDAALGTFGDEDDFGSDGNVRFGRSPRIAKLHSSERRGSPDAFGTVHRRTESAPTMPAVNRSTFSMHRLGSNASLTEDVFDEEEEDNFLAGKHPGPSNSDSSTEEIAQESKPSSPDSLPVSAPQDPTPADGLGLSLHQEAGDGVLIVGSEEDIARVDARSSNSTIEAPPIFPDLENEKRPMPSSMSFAYPAPQSHYASSTDGRTTSASMISSPDADHISFDTFPRPMRLPGEPSPDFALRASNDDLPSLSDSISSGALPRFSSSAGTRSSVEQRSASMIVPSTSKSNDQQAWKRTSLASLNRLIPGSSHGSKLKFETVPDTAVTDEKGRKKTNRISRLMHFWRSKERTDM